MSGLLLGLPFSWRQRRLALTRSPTSQSEFVRQIVDEGGDASAAAAVWDHLKDWILVDGLTPYPTDDLAVVYGLAEEELEEDLILDVLQRLGVPIPGRKVLADFDAVWTPLDVAVLVARSRVSASE